jgi:hypothetical protein
MPRTSGTPSAPIRFGSYGTGRARFVGSANANDVWLPSGAHDLTFDNLDFSGAWTTFGSSNSGPGTSNITIQNSNFHDTPEAAFNIANPADHDWTINNDTFNHTGDSAIFIWGNNITVSHSTFTDIGWNTSITWMRHGIYDKGPNNTIAYNDFSNIPNGQAISIRFHGAHVYANTIHDTPYAIGFFDYDTSPAPQGTSYVYDNRAWNISSWAFYYSGQADTQGNPPSVSFILASNTFALTGAREAVNLSEVPAGASIAMANNIFSGRYSSAYRGCATCAENNNDWFGGASNVPNGKGDKHVNPALSPAPQLAVPASSPVHAAGTALVQGLVYKAACDGGVLHYCGASPDQGAVVTLASRVTSRLGSGSKTASSTAAEKSAAPTHTKTAKRAKTAKAANRVKARNGTRFFTYKKNVKLRARKTLHYAPGKGYYAA